MELAILVGLQGAGKTSFHAHALAATHVHVSKDRLANNRQPQRRQLQLVEEALSSGHSVTVDNTNPAPADRAPLIVLGRRYGATVIAYSFESIVKDCLARNQLREGKARVPPVALFVTAKKLVPPDFAEGFDAIREVRLVPIPVGGFDVRERVRPLDKL